MGCMGPYLCFPVVRGRQRVVFCGWCVVVFSVFLVFGNVPLPLFCFPFLLTPTSRLAPTARTLLGVLGQATTKLLVVASRSFLVFCVCHKFCDLAKQRRKLFLGVPEVGKKTIFCFTSSGCTFSLFFLFLCCDRAQEATFFEAVE